MGDDAPKSDPPHWLQASDESWGPTEIRKRKPRPIVRRAPRSPSFWQQTEERHPYFTAVRWVAILAAALIGGAVLLSRIFGWHS